MAKTEVIIEAIVFVSLVYAYAKLCTHREIGIWGRFIEMGALYGWSIGTILGNIKFTFWAIGIAVIGLFKILTTKKAKSEGRNKGLVS